MVMLGDIKRHPLQEISKLTILIDGLQENLLRYYIFISPEFVIG